MKRRAMAQVIAAIVLFSLTTGRAAYAIDPMTAASMAKGAYDLYMSTKAQPSLSQRDLDRLCADLTQNFRDIIQEVKLADAQADFEAGKEQFVFYAGDHDLSRLNSVEPMISRVKMVLQQGTIQDYGHQLWVSVVGLQILILQAKEKHTGQSQQCNMKYVIDEAYKHQYGNPTPPNWSPSMFTRWVSILIRDWTNSHGGFPPSLAGNPSEMDLVAEEAHRKIDPLNAVIDQWKQEGASLCP